MTIMILTIFLINEKRGKAQGFYSIVNLMVLTSYSKATWWGMENSNKEFLPDKIISKNITDVVTVSALFIRTFGKVIT